MMFGDRNLRVVVASGGQQGASFLTEQLEGTRADVVVAQSNELEDLLVEADVVVCSDLTADVLQRAKHLKLVQVLGIGYDGVDTSALPAGCVLSNVGGHERAMAEWVAMAMLALTRGLVTYDRDFRLREWHEAYRFEGEPPRQINEMTVGIIGAGGVGRAVARLSKALGLRVIGVTRYPDRSRQEDMERLQGLPSLSTLMSEADFAVVALALSPETRRIIGANELNALGPGGYLINVARGPIVDEEALYTALRTGSIAGAALDVWYSYPAMGRADEAGSRFAFGELNNVIMTPHISGFSQQSFEYRWRFIAEQIKAVEAGDQLRNIIDVGRNGRG
jgi:phosphoglycerate dehydrogenase-like enzyme